MEGVGAGLEGVGAVEVPEEDSVFICLEPFFPLGLSAFFTTEHAHKAMVTMAGQWLQWQEHCINGKNVVSMARTLYQMY